MVNFIGILVFAGLTFKFKSITKPLTAKRYWLRQSRQMVKSHKKMQRAVERQHSDERLNSSSSSSPRASTLGILGRGPALGSVSINSEEKTEPLLSRDVFEHVV